MAFRVLVLGNAYSGSNEWTKNAPAISVPLAALTLCFTKQTRACKRASDYKRITILGTLNECRLGVRASARQAIS
ncbi:hypothetical protein [Bradyrhizobium sp. STM 3562]|uniref:hypothetical protein n=1 Tax=Bradyrhizobium sp. STM 3562 TaxID=578924 RepID=UPI00388F3624